ncbi:MAG: M23 family metallopeptidase [Acidobacteriota bacterium]
MPNSSRFEVFRDQGNLYTRIVPRWKLAAVAVVLFCVVAAGNIWWLTASLTHTSLEEELDEHLKAAAVRAQTVERISGKTSEIEGGVKRLQDVDSKLRDVIHLDKEARKAAQSAGEAAPARTDAQTVLTRMEVQSAFLRALNRPVRLAALDGKDAQELLATGPNALGAAPDAWPVRGVISSEFGMRLSPFAGQEEFHRGVDIMAPAGSPVRAPAPGRVSFAGEDAEGSLAVVLDHGGGYMTTFSHMQRVEVKPGESLQRGQDIGAVGQEGRSTGPHLHYEVRLHGVPVDPKKYLP